MIQSINCTHYDGYGYCEKKPKKFKIFYRRCEEIWSGKICLIADRYEIVEENLKLKEISNESK
jgi:hypothetical protein